MVSSQEVKAAPPKKVRMKAKTKATIVFRMGRPPQCFIRH